MGERRTCNAEVVGSIPTCVHQILWGCRRVIRLKWLAVISSPVANSSRCGEIADTPALEAGARKGVEVRILSSVLFVVCGVMEAHEAVNLGAWDRYPPFNPSGIRIMADYASMPRWR